MEKILLMIGVGLMTIIIGAIVLTHHEVQWRVAKDNVAMFQITPAQVDRIRIEGAEDEETLLVRRGEGWILPDLGDFPADAKKVDDALDRLLKLKVSQPVGSGETDLIRFKLAGDDFERRITFIGGDQTLATLYLGTPQGPRQVHARRAEEDKAFDVAFGLYDAPSDTGEWIDKGVLQIAPNDIAAIAVAGLRLIPAAPAANDNKTAPAAKDNKAAAAAGDNKTAPAANDNRVAVPTWQLDGKAEAPLKPSAAARLADMLAQLRVETMLSPEAQPDYGLDTPVLTFSVTRKDGTTVDYSLGKAALKEDYTLKASSWPEHFRLSSYTARRLIEAAKRDELLNLAVAAQHAAATDKDAGKGAAVPVGN